MEGLELYRYFFFISEFVMLLSKDSKKSSSKGKNKKLRTKKPHREAKTKDMTGKSTTQANANMNNLKTVRNISRYRQSLYSHSLKLQESGTKKATSENILNNNAKVKKSTNNVDQTVKKQKGDKDIKK